MLRCGNRARDSVPGKESAKGGALVVWQLARPRVLGLVSVTSLMGLVLGRLGPGHWGLAAWTLLGTGLMGAGAAALNQRLEWRSDGLMVRTRTRPLPAGLVAPWKVSLFGLTATITGGLQLWWKVNPLVSILGAIAVGLYLMAYTPLKPRTWLNAPVGALAGATPSLMGFAAVGNGLSGDAWLLFAVVFLWQQAHIHALGWELRDDYRRAGLRMLAVVDPSGAWVARTILASAVGLILLSLVLGDVAGLGPVFRWLALWAGGGLLVAAGAMCLRRTRQTTQWVGRMAMAYLPCLLVAMVAGVWA